MVPERTPDQLLTLSADGRPHEFSPDAVSPAVMSEVRMAETGKQLTDLYLLGLARRHGGRLVTFDRGLAAAGGMTLPACRQPNRDPEDSGSVPIASWLGSRQVRRSESHRKGAQGLKPRSPTKLMRLSPSFTVAQCDLWLHTRGSQGGQSRGK